MPIARVLPRIAGDLPRFANAASRQDDGASAKQHEAAGFAEVPQRSGHSSTPYKQAHNRAFHVHIEPGMHGLVLEDADHLQAGAVADVREAAVGVPAEWTLIDAPVRRSVEQRAPRLELANPVGRFLRMDLGHPPVVVHLAAAHRVAEMHAPVVFLHHVAERCRRAPLGHHGVGLAEQRFADQGDSGLLCAGFDGSTQPGAARADHEDVVVVRANVGGGHYRILMSGSTPFTGQRVARSTSYERMKMNTTAAYMKNRCTFWRMKGNLVSPR